METIKAIPMQTAENSKPSTSNNGNKRFATIPLPLLIQDILNIEIGEESRFMCEKSKYGTQFKKVMFHGRCQPLNNKSSKNDEPDAIKRSYTVDDGSENITVHYSHASGQIQGIVIHSTIFEKRKKMNFLINCF